MEDAVVPLIPFWLLGSLSVAVTTFWHTLPVARLCLINGTPLSLLPIPKFCFLPEAYSDGCRHVDSRQGWVFLFYIPTVCYGFSSCHYLPVSVLPSSFGTTP